MANGIDPTRGPRYPARVRCPDCGCDVAASSDGKQLRAHTSLALREGLLGAPCAGTSKRAQELLAQKHRNDAAERRKAYWAAKDAAQTVVSTLPKHLR